MMRLKEGGRNWKRVKENVSEKRRKREDRRRRKRMNVRDLGRVGNRDEQGEEGGKWESEEE